MDLLDYCFHVVKVSLDSSRFTLPVTDDVNVVYVYAFWGGFPGFDIESILLAAFTVSADGESQDKTRAGTASVFE